MLLVDEHGIGQRPDFLCCLDCVFGQIRFGFDVLKRVDPRACVFCAASVLRDGDDLKVLVFQLLIDCLPAWQVKAAPSP
jgi:hypothetical protein